MALAPESLETLKAQGFYRYWIERDYAAAITIFERIRQQSPSDDAATYALAAIARRQGRWSDSLPLWNQALIIDPRNPETYLDAAETAQSFRDTGTANRILDRGLAFFPDNSGLLSIRVNVLLQTGDVESAHQILDRIHIESGDDNLVQQVAVVAALRRQYDAAITLLKSQLQNPDLPVYSRGNYQLGLGDLYRLSSDATAARQAYEAARQSLQTALGDQPDNPNLFSSLAWAAAGLGNRDEAYTLQRRAIELLPTSRDAYVGPFFEEGMARLQSRFGDKAAAVSALRRLLQTSYGDPPLTPAILRIDPDFDNLRNDPDFQKLLSDAGGAAAHP